MPPRNPSLTFLCHRGRIPSLLILMMDFKFQGPQVDQFSDSKVDHNSTAKRQRTHDRTDSRNKKAQKLLSDASNWFDSHETGCCHSDCQHLYSLNHVEVFRHAIGQAYNESAEKKREFVANRILYVETKVDEDDAEYRQSKLFHLDHPVAMIKPHMSFTSTLPQQPVRLQPVCGKYFKWVLNVSNNFIYQPNKTSKRMTVVTTPRAPQESVKASKVISWLILLASFYLFSPTSSDIYLPFANKMAVWAMFTHESAELRKKRSVSFLNLMMMAQNLNQN